MLPLILCAPERYHAIFRDVSKNPNLLSEGIMLNPDAVVTAEFLDHQRQARSPDNRLDSAWFGTGAAIKEKALKEALLLL